VFHQETTFTKPVADVNPCTGEPYAGAETVHLVTTGVTTPNGQVTHLSDLVTVDLASGTTTLTIFHSFAECR
jgi:hypothetical protein